MKPPAAMAAQAGRHKARRSTRPARPEPLQARRIGHQQQRVKFCDHIKCRGSGGAIDFVIHAEAKIFTQAVKRLRQLAGDLAAEPEPKPESRRAIARDCHAALRRRRILYADARRNAVFLSTDQHQKPTGAECCGTVSLQGRQRFRGMAPRSRKNCGSFQMPADNTPLHTLIIAESAIDALSLADLRSPGTVLLSTCGATSQLPAWLEAWTPQRIICAFDADDAGDQAADRLAATDPRIRRLRAKGEKDWNEILAARHAE